MTTTQTEVESQIIELSTKAFKSFCADISQMFSVDMSCKPPEPCAETVKGLAKKYKKLAAVITVESEGVLKGNFQFIFDKIGLFTLSGVIVMLPEERILKASKYGSTEDAEDMSDTFGEAGNLLVGAWDRLFRDELEDHGHFAQLNTFIGNPWNKPDEKIGLGRDEELLFIRHEITIGSYPSFKCGIIFPKRIFADISELNTETTDNIEEKDEEKTEEKTQEQQAPAQQTEPEESVEDRKTDAVESESQDSIAEKAEEKPESEKAVDEKETIAEEHPEPTAEPKIEAEQADVFSGDVKEEAVSVNDTYQDQMGPVSETIKRMTETQGIPPGEFGRAAWDICANDIMQKEVLWANADDSVQQALTKMDEANTGYLIIGTAGVIEGIVSRSDLAGAISPYLRPMFAKWRRPLDDATLKIRIKWIMSRLVRTVNPETPFPVIIQNMCQHDGHCCLPVVDNNGKVQGMITTFDIYSVLLKTVSG
jgi:CBS domain-containing protein